MRIMPFHLCVVERAAWNKQEKNTWDIATLSTRVYARVYEMSSSSLAGNREREGIHFQRSGILSPATYLSRRINKKPSAERSFRTATLMKIVALAHCDCSYQCRAHARLSVTLYSPSFGLITQSTHAGIIRGFIPNARFVNADRLGRRCSSLLISAQKWIAMRELAPPGCTGCHDCIGGRGGIN